MKTLTCITVVIHVVYSLTAGDFLFQCPQSTTDGGVIARGAYFLDPVRQSQLKNAGLDTTCRGGLAKATEASIKIPTVEWRNTSGSIIGVTSELPVQSPCILDSITMTEVAVSKKILMCLDISCNMSSKCHVILNILMSANLCQNLRSCNIQAFGQKYLLMMQPTPCVDSIWTGDGCFTPRERNYTLPSVLTDHQSLPVACYAFPTSTTYIITDSLLKLWFDVALGPDKTKHKCDTATKALRYQCIIGYASYPLFIGNLNDVRVRSIAIQMMKNPLGRPFIDKNAPFPLFYPIGTIMANLTFNSHKASMESFYAYAGEPPHTSLYVTLCDKKTTPIPFLALGLYPAENPLQCHLYSFPSVWFDFVTFPGVFESFQECTVFCTYSGSGAACEIFARGGIYHVEATGCLMDPTHRYPRGTDTVQFKCPGLHSVLEIKCNGRELKVHTETLSIGSCIQSLDSLFSILSRYSHPLAVELCLPGAHGWFAWALLITICFGFILIPVVTKLLCMFIIRISKLFILDKTSFQSLLKRMKKELQRTVGDTTCEVCNKECETPEELNAHKGYCVNGICPYCLNDIGKSGVLLSLHEETCLRRNRFKEFTSNAAQRIEIEKRLCLRRIKVFRYQNRFFVATVWLLLIMIELTVWAATALEFQTDVAHGVASVKLTKDLELSFSLPGGSSYTYLRDLESTDENKQPLHFQLSIDQAKMTVNTQYLGEWVNAHLQIGGAFHCYGACDDYLYPWNSSLCKTIKNYEYETAWDCNPGSCPGVGTGCTACAAYLERFHHVGAAYRVLSKSQSRNVCYQIGGHRKCFIVLENDCYSDTTLKICIGHTISKFKEENVLLFEPGKLTYFYIINDWCTTKCVYGMLGDVMFKGERYICPEVSGVFQKKCFFATTPRCEFTGEMLSGYDRFTKTKDLYLTYNISQLKIGLDGSSLEWLNVDGLSRSQIDISVSKDQEFEDLDVSSCQVKVRTMSLSGCWGGGTGFSLECELELGHCQEFQTVVKACDNSACYGFTSVLLHRGRTTTKVTGRGGHSGSEFRCCHKHNCSSETYRAKPPMTDRVVADGVKVAPVYSDGKEGCGITCWVLRVGEWLSSFATTSWWVFVIIGGVVIIMFYLFTCLFKKRG